MKIHIAIRWLLLGLTLLIGLTGRSQITLEIDPAASSYSVNQTVTVTARGGQAGTTYTLSALAALTGTTLSSVYINNGQGGNIVAWATGQTEATFLVRFLAGSIGTDRVLQLSNNNADNPDIGQTSALTIIAPPVITVTPIPTGSEAQTVTVKLTGGIPGIEYVVQLYEGPPYDDNDLSDIITPFVTAPNLGGINTVEWTEGMTEAQFTVRFDEGSKGTNRVLVVGDLDMTHLALSNPFSIVTCPISVSIEANTPTTVASGGSVTLTASGAAGYTWSNGSTDNPLVLNNITASTTVFATGVTGECSAKSNEITMAVTTPCPAGGETWIARTAVDNNTWTSVTYGNGLFVAVASDGTSRVMTSPDGINWTGRAGLQSFWSSVTYGNGLFVAVATFGTNRVMTSPDGINWTARTAVGNHSWNSVTYGNGLFVAVAQFGANNVMTSPDGINWTGQTGLENFWNSVTYGNGLFVAVAADYGSPAVMTSPDGINWTGRSSAEDGNWTSVTNGNGLFVAVSIDGTNRVMTSPDGINWTGRAGLQNFWTSVTYGNGLFVAVATSGDNRVMTSPDGINWTAQTATANDNTWYSVTYGNGLFVAVADTGNNTVMTSATGVPPSVTIASNDADNSITAGTSVTFTATPTNGGTTPAYQWKKNNSNVGTNSNTYTDAALVNNEVITVVMTSNDACASPALATSNEITMTVTAACTTPTVFAVTGGGAYCAGSTGVAVGLANSETGVTYQLKKDNVDDGVAVAGTTGMAITFGNKTGAGVYTVVATRTVGACTNNMTGSVTVSITPASVGGTVGAAQTICTGTAPADLTLSGNIGSVVKWQKSSDAAFTSPIDIASTSATLASASIGNLTVNTYFRAVVKSGACSEANSSAVLITVKPIPAKPTISGNSEICYGQSTALVANDTTSAASTHAWSFGLTGRSIVVSPLITTNYQVAVTVNGCTSDLSAVFTVTVNPKPSAPTITADNMSICKGGSAILTGTCAVSAHQFRWITSDFNTNGVASLPNSNVRIITTPGVYRGLCESDKGCQGEETSITISQGDDCNGLNFITITPEKPAICPGSSIVLTAGGCSGTITWLGGPVAQTGNSATFSPAATTTYFVQCSTGGSATVTVVVASANVAVANNITTGIERVKAVSNITSDKKVGSATFTPGANVIYEAGKSITLNPGFVAEKWSVFKAEIKGCN